GQFGTVDRTVPVEVEERQIIGVGGIAAERVTERGQVQAVARLVAVDIAEETEEARHIVPALDAALHLGAEYRQRVVAVDQRWRGRRAFGECAGKSQLDDRL